MTYKKHMLSKILLLKCLLSFSLLSVCLSVCLSFLISIFPLSLSFFLLLLEEPLFLTLSGLYWFQQQKNPYNCCLPRHYIFTTNWYESIFFFLCYMTIQQSTIGHDHCWWGFIWKLESFLWISFISYKIDAN